MAEIECSPEPKMTRELRTLLRGTANKSDWANFMAGAEEDVPLQSKIDGVYLTDESDSELFMEAKIAEIQKWKAHESYKTVKRDVYKGMTPLTLRWVLTWKTRNGKQMPNARLVVKGFQENHGDELPTSSPTASREVVRIALMEINSRGWPVRNFDIKSAFHNSRQIARTVIVEPPSEAQSHPQDVWKLTRSVYGSAFQNREGGRSQSGWVCCLDQSVVAWRSTLCKRVVKSTMAAETITAGEGCDAAKWIQWIVEEINPTVTVTITLMSDC
eukprot:GHVN01054075.1.p1 GENE.GHVN01054075.1~~GHVN01054075.1.p1  ORF type:complete len:272 (+),score=22.60 GHVN01054075.1:1210-2025(+)